MLNKRLIYIILGAFLILTGLLTFISGLGALSIVVSILALLAGILIVVIKPGISTYAGWVLGAIFLILLSLSGIFGFSFSGMGTILGVLAVAAGAVLLIGRPGFSHHIGFFLFCVWLILVGLSRLVGLGEISIITAIIAVVSGILMILNE